MFYPTWLESNEEWFHEIKSLCGYDIYLYTVSYPDSLYNVDYEFSISGYFTKAGR
ncbi:hypothetical protein LEP1GSC195_0273 [Leptospira wolbachii serovar Codice str. CDC]|uniref:Uncharacterized protein n=1 Tax=Leptospira wolbachii serovar Codice str. CDC TaxID=1218599 RepID=R9A6R6_9LEPT|nr:hypothetical protein LEP1GSC195_0273 [Leptospira wolbachii serovar Codice str. CDC]